MVVLSRRCGPISVRRGAAGMNGTLAEAIQAVWRIADVKLVWAPAGTCCGLAVSHVRTGVIATLPCTSKGVMTLAWQPGQSGQQ
ncbi:hypothetical protein GCM10008955_30890 [Deinococcus malanensis]|uniref:Uncharacterized protein n=1 Tax=Deinococcus malanensis TaxID=1706855 RepID=A0ABQ2F2U0_9DEIO|nr:hypothetical protein GCM10008955_30890 [Deinococcus malanensis]